MLRKELLDYLRLQNQLGLGGVSVFDSDLVDKEIGSDKKKSWDDFRSSVLICAKCSLAESRTQVVFGTGCCEAELMFVGEAPGFDEDRLGQPFVGRAGEQLTKIIRAMGYDREEVYIANIVKCRPPGNRNPQVDEINVCNPYLLEQIRRINPKVVCALGSIAAQTLIGTDEKISRLRGKFFDLNGIKIMPTFHPAYLLRNPEYKREVWTDMQRIMEILKK